MLTRHQKPKHNICYNQSNIFDATKQRVFGANNGATILLPHVCNNINLFGAGFASAITKNYPIVKDNFHMLGNKAKLGHVQYIKVLEDKTYKHQLIIANMISQNHVVSPKNIRPLNYEYLVKCMIDVRNQSKILKEQTESAVEIHCPKFGSGLAGGDWSFIEYLIEDIWFDNQVFVYMPQKNNK